MKYPIVLDEFNTLRMLVAGMSIARFGDGELKLCYGKGYSRQSGNLAISNELRRIIRSPAVKCIVGIPTMDVNGPKIAGWERHQARFAALLNSHIDYYSAFISRPDSAPWISTKNYAADVVSIWAGKHVTVLSEHGNSLLALVRKTSDTVVHFECPSHQAYSRIDEFEQAIVSSSPDIALLSCGPTATCLADRLTRRGIQALDLGSIGGFLRKMLA